MNSGVVPLVSAWSTAALALRSNRAHSTWPFWMPTSCVSAAGQNGEYAKPDGTLFSEVAKVELKVDQDDPVLTLSVERVTPTAVSGGCAGLGDAVDSDYIKTVRITSTLLSEFWGRDISIEACVLIPEGFHDPKHKDATYPIAIAHGEWLG